MPAIFRRLSNCSTRLAHVRGSRRFRVQMKSLAKRYCIEKDANTLPTLALQVMERRPVGRRTVFDLAVNDLHAFVQAQ